MHPFPVEARTASDGTFAIECLAVGENPTTVRAKDLGPWTGTCRVVAHGVTPLVVRLSQGVICTGTVRDDTDQPMARVVVQSGELGTLAHMRAVTAADGTYRLAGLPTGQIELLADGGKRGRESTKIQAAAGETLRWEPCSSLREPGDPFAGPSSVAQRPANSNCST